MISILKFKTLSIVSIVSFLVFAFFTTQPQPTQAASIAENVKGRILLQVQQNGEAWYVNPDTQLRHYMGRPKDAFELMRSQGLGISNSDIVKIPIGLQSLSGTDTDGDGLSDIFEDAIGSDKTKADTDSDGFNDYTEVENGFNPAGAGSSVIDNSLTNRLKGKILLQVQGLGEAWYVNPVDGKRYFLGRPADAFTIMRNLGLGITDQDLEQISIDVGEIPVSKPGWITTVNQQLGIRFEHPADTSVSSVKQRLTTDGTTINELTIIPEGTDPTRVDFFSTNVPLDQAKNIQIYGFTKIDNSEFGNIMIDGRTGIRRIDHYLYNDCTNELTVVEKNGVVYGTHIVQCPTHPQGYDQLRRDIADSLEFL